MLTVGVVIPAYNAAAFVADALESLLAQTSPPAQVVVVDDGSTDETARVLAKYEGHVDIVRQGNRGSCAARNAGLARLATDAVVFLDADDLLLPGALARRSALLGETDAAWAHTEGYVEHAGTRRLFSDHRPPSRGKLDGDLFADLLLRNFITTDAVIARRSVVQALGGFDEEIRGTEDWDLWLRLAARHPVRYSPEPTFVYRRGSNTLSSDRRAMDRMRWLTLVKAHRRFPAKVRAAGTAGRRSVADAENGLAYLAAREGRWREASAGLWTSVRLAPRQGRAWAVLLRCLARAASTTRGRHG